MTKIVVLGAGLVGRHIACDLRLTQGHDVTSIDITKMQDFFEDTGVTYYQAHHQALVTNLSSLVGVYDLVVCALPGKLGYQTIKGCIELGKDVVDISFMEEDPTDLRELAREKGVRVITDIGVAPGLCGVWLAHEHANDPNIESAKIMVGGLPKHPGPPYYYKAPFEPMGVIAEYTRPVRMRNDGLDIIVEPLTEMEHISAICNLVSFNTDGCRTLLKSFPNIPNLVEKTIRDERHYNFMKELKTGGFFDESCIENTAKVMLPKWKLNPDEPEYTFMLLDLVYKDKLVKYRLNDEGQTPETKGVSSMARTTGYTCNAAVKLLTDNKITKPGLYLPEEIGRTFYPEIKDYLYNRNVRIERNEIIKSTY